MNRARLEALKKRRVAYYQYCKHCGPFVPHWVKSGKCQKCHPRERGTYTKVMKRLFPVGISRADAESMSLPMFRPDTPCPHGHQSWRYVRTPNICLDRVAVRRDLLEVAQDTEWRQQGSDGPLDDFVVMPGMTLEIARALGLPLDKLY